jgi:hypothetical protein
VQVAPAESVVGRAVVVRSVARHCSPGGGGWRRWRGGLGKKLANVTGQAR